MKLKLSEAIKISYKKIKISPNGEIIAFVPKLKSGKAEIALVFTEFNDEKRFEIGCESEITKIEFSNDSKYLMIFSKDSDCVFMVNCNNGNIENHEFSPSLKYASMTQINDNFITISEFNLNLSISIIGKQIKYIFKCPKFGDKRAFDYCPSGKYIAIAERLDCKDYLSLYDSSNLYKLFTRFRTNTEDLQLFKWNSNGLYICVVDSELTNKICIYSINGEELKSIKQDVLTFSRRNAIWSPCGTLMATNNTKNINLHHAISPEFSISIPLTILKNFLLNQNDQKKGISISVYIEVSWDYLSESRNSISTGQNKRCKFVTKLDSRISERLKKCFTPFNPSEIGISSSKIVKNVIWSCDSRYLAFIFVEKIVVVYDLKLFTFATAIFLKSAVRNICWLNQSKIENNNNSILLINRGTKELYFWKEEKCGVFELSKGFEETKLIPSKKNEVFLLGKKGIQHAVIQ